MTITRNVIVLFIFLGLLLLGVASGFVAQREYKTALDGLVAESLARVQNRPTLELSLYRQDETGLDKILGYLLQRDAVSVAIAYSDDGEMLAMQGDNSTLHRQLPSLEAIRSSLAIADTGLKTFDGEQELPGIGFWSLLKASDPTIHFTTPVYTSANFTDKSPDASSSQETLDRPAIEAVASLPSDDSDDSDQSLLDISLPGEETSGGGGTTIHRVNVGGPEYTDSSGNVWSADSFFNTGIGGGRVSVDIADTSDPKLYQTERWDKRAEPELLYTLPVSNGMYTVRLHFAEVFRGASMPGSRVFDVEIEGVTALSGYDIVADVGFRTAVVKEISNVDVTDGNLSIELLHVNQNPKISAIEVIDDSEPDAPDVDVSSAPQESDDVTVDGDGQQTLTQNKAGTATTNGPEGSTDETSMPLDSLEGGPGSAISDSPIVIGFIRLAIEPSVLLRDSRTAAGRVLFGGLFLLFLCAPAFYLVTKRTMVPLRKLTLVANQLVSGESAEEVSVEEGSALSGIARLLNIINEVDLEHKRLVVQSDEQATQLSLSEQELSKATEEINSNRELLHRLANYDRLTSLPNRHLFSEQLGVLIRQCARSSQTLAVLLLKLEGFKRINDSLGRHTGDLLLREVAGRLLGCMRHSDILGHYVEAEEEKNVARLGGDEFALVLSQLDNADAAESVAKRINELLSEPMLIDSHELVITPNIGIALAPRNGTVVEELLRAADIALHHAELSGSRFLFYAEDMVSTGQDDLKMEAELRKAIERNQLSLHYQPQVDTADGSIICAEAFLRWEHPEYGQVPPARFINLAEKSSLIWELGDWVLVEVCRQMCVFREQGLELPRIAINVSPEQFKPAFVDRLREVLGAADLPASMIELGLSEAVLMDGDSSLLNFMQELKEAGVYLSLENFGISYAPLSYLGRVPLDEIKIDRNFLIDCDIRKEAGRLVKAIIAMAESLELPAVAEGVETAGQYRFLAENGIRIMRGYLFSAPLPGDELEKLLVVPWHFSGHLQRLALMTELDSPDET